MPVNTTSSGLSYSLPQTSHRLIWTSCHLGLHLASLKTRFCRLHHLVLFRILDSFFDQLLGKGLFVRRRNRRRLLTHRLWYCFPPVFFGKLLRWCGRRVQTFRSGELSPGLFQVTIQHLLGRTPIDNRQLASALPHHSLSNGA